ncbi:hypothetical protein PE061_07655 [Sphingosinicella microcystinivorans]|nr:hypothetical protein [Sphingosinicella microcystinivorans]WBX85773.1 hypothetical protein PE061_07655 [Sphingosinicella microcystinivorans]
MPIPISAEAYFGAIPIEAPLLRQRGIVDDQLCRVTSDKRIDYCHNVASSGALSQIPRTNEVMQSIITDFIRPRSHRLDALSISQAIKPTT